jgi:hypothetical protein
LTFIDGGGATISVSGAAVVGGGTGGVAAGGGKVALWGGALSAGAAVDGVAEVDGVAAIDGVAEVECASVELDGDPPSGAGPDACRAGDASLGALGLRSSIAPLPGEGGGAGGTLAIGGFAALCGATAAFCWVSGSGWGTGSVVPAGCPEFVPPMDLLTTIAFRLAASSTRSTFRTDRSANLSTPVAASMSGQ